MLVYWRSPIFATYEQNGNNANPTEQHLYGSARLGMRQTNLLVKNSAGIVSLNPNQRVFYRSVGHKAYEQCNHLGDVLVTLSDKVLNQGGYYQAIVKNASLTYPFGWAIPERTYTSTAGEYRFGFNGKENDKETGWQDYGFRLYNTQIARFFSVDPLTFKYPYYTPYQFAGNMPIAAVDLDGAEPIGYDYSLQQREIRNLTNPRTAAELEEELKVGLTMMAIAIPVGLALPVIAGGVSSSAAAASATRMMTTVVVTSKRGIMDIVKGWWKRATNSNAREIWREAKQLAKEAATEELFGDYAPILDAIPQGRKGRSARRADKFKAHDYQSQSSSNPHGLAEPTGEHYFGSEKAPTRGGKLNSVYSFLNKEGKVKQNTIYDSKGDAIGHFDFEGHGVHRDKHMPAWHGHDFSNTPGQPFGGHGKAGADSHIPGKEVPASWKKLPPGVKAQFDPNTPSKNLKKK